MLFLDESSEERVANHWIPEAVAWVKMGYILYPTQENPPADASAKCIVHLKVALPVHKSELSIAWMDDTQHLPGGPVWSFAPSPVVDGHWVGYRGAESAGTRPGSLRPSETSPHARFLPTAQPLVVMLQAQADQRALFLSYWKRTRPAEGGEGAEGKVAQPPEPETRAASGPAAQRPPSPGQLSSQSSQAKDRTPSAGVQVAAAALASAQPPPSQPGGASHEVSPVVSLK